MPLKTLSAPVLKGPGDFFSSNIACTTLQNCRLYQAFFKTNFFTVVAYKRMSLIREMSVYRLACVLTLNQGLTDLKEVPSHWEDTKKLCEVHRAVRP